MDPLIQGSHFNSIKDVAFNKEQQKLNKDTSNYILKGNSFISAEDLKKTDLFSVYENDQAFNNLLAQVTDENGNVDADAIEFLGIAADASKYAQRTLDTKPTDLTNVTGFYLDGVGEEGGMTHFDKFTVEDYQAYKQAKAEAHNKQIQEISDLKKASQEYQANFSNTYKL